MNKSLGETIYARIYMYRHSTTRSSRTWVHFQQRYLFKGVLHLLPKISMFCALSQNSQQLFEKKSVHLKKNCSRNSKMALKF